MKSQLKLLHLTEKAVHSMKFSIENYEILTLYICVMLTLTSGQNLPYFFGYKLKFFPSKTIPENRSVLLGKTCIIAKLHRTDLVVICSHSREGKILSYCRINVVIF